MRVIIAGSRTIPQHLCYDYLIDYVIGIYPKMTTVVGGGASAGPDAFAPILAKEYGMTYKEFPADWNKHGKAAGMLRNTEMAAYADALFALWDGKSKGTKHMVRAMMDLNKPVHLITVPI